MLLIRRVQIPNITKNSFRKRCTRYSNADDKKEFESNVKFGGGQNERREQKSVEFSGNVNIPRNVETVDIDGNGVLTAQRIIEYQQEVFGDKLPDQDIDEEMQVTIRLFFENNLNISETARQLYLHRNTLVYRLERFEKLVGLDIRRFDDAMTFQIAMMVLAHYRQMYNMIRCPEYRRARKMEKK